MACTLNCGEWKRELKVRKSALFYASCVKESIIRKYLEGVLVSKRLYLKMEEVEYPYIVKKKKKVAKRNAKYGVIGDKSLR